MADPGTLALAAIAASSAFSGISSISQGITQQNLAEANAEAALQEAQQRDRLAQIEAARVRREGRRFGGRVEAAIGANVGFSGTALGVLADLAKEQELDVRLSRFQGTLAKRAGQQEARFQGFRGRVAKQQGFQGAIGSLLSGGARGAAFQSQRGN